MFLYLLYLRHCELCEVICNLKLLRYFFVMTKNYNYFLLPSKLNTLLLKLDLTGLTVIPAFTF